jgi:glycosyltransferase involved in cell wall biosynthesis
MSIAVVVEQLCRQPSGGIGVYASQLCRSLEQNQAMQIAAVSSRYGQSGGTSLRSSRFVHTPHRITNELFAHRLPVPGWRSATRPAELIHATSFDLPRRDSRPRTVFVHDVLWRRWPQTYSKRGVHWHERALCRALEEADHFLVPSNAVRTDLIAAGAANDRISVTGEGSDHLPNPGQSGVELDRRTYLLSVATAQPRKNLPGLLRAYQRYRRLTPTPLDLHVVGPAGWGPDLPPPTQGVKLCGSVSDAHLSTLYAGAAALVLVPFEEGFGLPVVEAWRAGVPVIASSTVPVAAAHPSACYLVELADTNAIAETILQACTDLVDAARCVREGRALAQTMTWESVAQQHITVWNKVLGR